MQSFHSSAEPGRFALLITDYQSITGRKAVSEQLWRDAHQSHLMSFIRVPGVGESSASGDQEGGFIYQEHSTATSSCKSHYNQ